MEISLAPPPSLEEKTPKSRGIESKQKSVNIQSFHFPLENSKHVCSFVSGQVRTLRSLNLVNDFKSRFLKKYWINDS